MPTSLPVILVVDDNDLARTVLCRQLGRAGYEVESVANGLSALEILTRKPIDLVLLDFVMEPMSGIEVLERIRRVRTPLQIPVIMMSASKDQRLIVRATDLGANDFLFRPLHVRVLDAKIRHLLQLRKTTRNDEPGPTPVVASDGNLEPGSEVGPYRIDSLLGEGSMGRVFQATDTRLLRPVALKVLWQHCIKDQSREQFLKEARALARVQHPNVATIYDLGLGQFPYLVMELVQGAALSAELKKGPPSLKTATRWSIEILQALGAIHVQGIVHRDLKPDNILLTEAGQIKVVDFGVAHFLQTDEGETTGGLRGTPEWMSPEQISTEGPPPDCRSDLFSLASILYFLLTGTHPFPAQNLTQQLFLISTQEPQSPLEINAAIPPSLSELCLKGLCKEPSGRFQTAEEFAFALQEHYSRMG